MARRVVVTGVGLICGVGNNAEDVWKALLAGTSGIERITSFDVSQFACQIGAEVKNFDPLQYVEKKEARKMARFIHLAIAAWAGVSVCACPGKVLSKLGASINGITGFGSDGGGVSTRCETNGGGCSRILFHT